MMIGCCISFVFYIKPQLMGHFEIWSISCISFVFYIKPQLPPLLPLLLPRCISFVFYIKPQPISHPLIVFLVVYLSFSTSNHNNTAITLV